MGTPSSTPILEIGPPHTNHGTYPILTSGGHNWRPVQTCSLEDLTPPSTDIQWQPPKHVRLASGWYASYWNAFLLLLLPSLLPYYVIYCCCHCCCKAYELELQHYPALWAPGSSGKIAVKCRYPITTTVFTTLNPCY